MIILLPVNASAYFSAPANYNEAESIRPNSYAQGCSGEYPYLCGGDCWKCNNPNNKFTCYNNKPKCCPSNNPYYCSKTDSCWKDSNQCDNAIQCNGGWWACTTSNNKANCVNNQVYCCPSETPYYWGGSCHKCSSDFPNECGGNCWTTCNDNNYPNWNCKQNGQGTCCPSDYPTYCDKTGSCWKNSNECNNAEKCGNEGWTVCRDSNYPNWNCGADGKSVCCNKEYPYFVNAQCSKCPADRPSICGETCYNPATECNGNTVTCKNNQIYCCDSDNPYYCERTSGCWLNEERCNTAIYCGDKWWACNDASYIERCVENQSGCCPSQYPYYCPSNNICFKQDGFCDGRQTYNCNGKYWVCTDKSNIGTCSGDELKCCPSQYPYWWESDKQCHASKFEQKSCTIPDGSSSQCDCNTNSDCPSSKPFCEELYPSPISDGYDACITQEPEYCGNGKCIPPENYNSCTRDCSSYAPRGTITVDAQYNKGSYAKQPIGGANIYLEGVLKGTTDKSGKKTVETAYGQNTISINCPEGSFCESRTINVDGEEYASFKCNCNPPGDKDGDGYMDEDERLLGTDANNANSNYETTFASDSVDLIACLPTPATLIIIWKDYQEGKDLLQANEKVLNALNVTKVTGTSLKEKPLVVAEAIIDAKLQAGIETKTNATLQEAVRNAEYVDGIYTQNELLLIATDKETKTTTIIAIGAGCVGAFTGTGYGFGQGAVDDVKGVVEGIWFVITHLGDIGKIWDGVTKLVSEVVELLKKPGEAVWPIFRGILEKGKGINIFREDRLNNKEAYRHFQAGFVYGFVTGYLTEQVAALLIPISKVSAAFKTGKLFGAAGKAAKLSEKLALIRKTEDLGSTVAEKLSKLKYISEAVEKWTDGELKGLARAMKHNEEWLKGLSEADAKIAAKRIDTLTSVKKLADNDIKLILDTNIGRKTITAADTTEDLLAKQAKLASNWGAKELDKVANRFDGFWPWQKNGWKKVNRLVDKVPENAVDGLTSQKAIKFLGNEKLIEAVEKVSESFTKTELSSAIKNFDDFEAVSTAAEKILKYVPDFKSLPRFTNDFPPHLEMLRDLGKLQDVKGFGNVVRNIATQGGGFPYEARRAAILKENSNIKLVELGKKTEVKFVDIDGIEKIEQLDMDVFYEFKAEKIKVIEEIKTKESGVIGASYDLKTQILKMNEALNNGIADEAYIVTPGIFDKSVLEFIQKNGNKVKLIEGGI